MTLKKGDKVKFLNDVGGGVITRIENKLAYVRNMDGFEVPVTLSQLLKAEVEGETSTPFAAAEKEIPVASPCGEPPHIPEQGLDYIDLSEEAEENIDTSVSILLAWTVSQKKGENFYDLYLINDCSYHIMYVSTRVLGGACRGIQAGMLENDSSIHLAEIPESELREITDIRLEALFFKKGTFMPQEPVRYKLKIDDFYLMDPARYIPNDYLEEKALIFNVTEEFLLAEIENVARTGLAQPEKEKKHIDMFPEKPAVKKKTKQPTEEIDLHIEQLIDTDPKQLSAGEILDIQMGRFNIALEGAIRNRQKRIIFIHGVGNGRLRHEIHRALDRRIPKLRYQDASFKEYGYGATLVFL
jgi:hypothetical protein